MPRTKIPLPQEVEAEEGGVVSEEASQIEVVVHLLADHHSGDHPLDLSVVLQADHEMDPLPTAAGKQCLLQVEVHLEVHLENHEEGRRQLTTGMMTATMVHPLNVGIHQGTMTVAVTVNGNGKDHQVIAMIITAAGILPRSVVQAVEVVAIQVVTEGTAHPWTEAMHPLIAMVVLREVIHLTVDMGTAGT